MTTGILPPRRSIGPVAWLRENLFSTWYDAVLTIVLGAVLAIAALRVGEWVVSGARWGVVTGNLRLFLVGQYPFDLAWRIWLGLAMLSILAGLSAAIFGSADRWSAAPWSSPGWCPCQSSGCCSAGCRRSACRRSAPTCGAGCC